MLDAQAPKKALFRRGLGYGWDCDPHPYLIHFDRIVDRPDSPLAMVTILHRIGNRVIERKNVALLSIRSVAEFVAGLDKEFAAEENPIPWQSIFRQAAISVTHDRTKPGQLVTVNLDDEHHIEAVKFRVDELLVDGVINTWIAAGGTGKSTLAVICGVAVTLGIPFLGKQATRGTVLYLDWESSEQDFRDKVAQAVNGFGVRQSAPIHYLRMRGPLRDEIYALVDMVSDLGIDLVIIDAVAAAGGSMGAGSYESLALDLENALQQLPGVTVLLLDHVTGEDVKLDNAPEKARGSVRKTEFTRNQWTLIRDRGAASLGTGAELIGWKHTKSNRTRLYPSFSVRFERDPNNQWIRATADEAALVDPLYDRMSIAQKIVDLLRKRGRVNLQAIIDDLSADDPTLKADTVRKAVTRGRDKKIWQYTKDGQVWLLDQRQQSAMEDLP